VPGVLALDPAADLIDRGEPEAHHVEGIQHPHGVRQGGAPSSIWPPQVVIERAGRPRGTTPTVQSRE
jgi:hypothetical protein